MHLLWINEQATLAGGCEHYVRNTAVLLRERGVRSTLLYDPRHPADPGYFRAFDGAFPLVDPRGQVAALAPDLVYVHQLRDVAALEALRLCAVPAVRFFHDHKLFCLREYKYTTLGHRTCSRAAGWVCYPCLGFLRRSPAWPGLKVFRLARLRADQQANRFFDAYVVGSRYMAEEAAAHGFERARLHVIPLYAHPPSEAAPAPREEGLALFVGQLLRGKGLDVLLHALSRVRRPVRLVVAGLGKQRIWFEALSGRLGLANRVTFAGRLSSDQLAGLYRRAAFLVVPSRSPESFSLAGVEALSHGTPVIASAVGGMGEWLEHERTGLAVPSGDPEALALAIERLAGDVALAAELGAEGRRRFEAKFRPEHHLDLLEALFARLLRGKTPA